MDQPTCLLVGAPGVGKYTLIKSLQQHPQDQKTSSGTYSLRLDTKYYTADVTAQAVGTQHQLSSSTQLEALVLIFESSKQASFDKIRNWADEQDTESIEVKLVVANKADMQQQASGSRSRPAWLDDAMSWCYDGGYEYIEAAAEHPKVDAQLQLDGEQQGVARVLAALQAHMWPGMLQKNWAPGPLPSSGVAVHVSSASGSSGSSSSSSRDQGKAAAVAADGDTPPKGALSHVSSAACQQTPEQEHLQEQQQEQPVGTPGQQQLNVSMSSSFGSSHAGEVRQHLEQAPVQQERRQPPAAPHGAPAAAAAVGEDELDLDLDDFEKLMRQMQGQQQQAVLH